MKRPVSNSTTHQVTLLLLAWGGGDTVAAEQLLAVVYEELRRLARNYLRGERGDHTLQPTALVHEAYLRLVNVTQIDWKSRAHFYGIAARVMRQVLVDHSRRKGALKRGGLAETISLDQAGELAQSRAVDFVSLDTALEALARDYSRPSKVVELRFFGGMTALEIGEVLHVTDRTVERDWEFARWWLRRELNAQTRPTPEHKPHDP